MQLTFFLQLITEDYVNISRVFTIKASVSEHDLLRNYREVHISYSDTYTNMIPTKQRITI